MCNWIKCNSDGVAKGSPGIASCGGIFLDYKAAVIDCFAANLGVTTSLFAELNGVILAIEIAEDRGWNNIWFNVTQH